MGDGEEDLEEPEEEEQGVAGSLNKIDYKRADDWSKYLLKMRREKFNYDRIVFLYRKDIIKQHSRKIQSMCFFK